MQHDVQELCRKLIDNIEERMKGHPDVEGAVQKLKKFENVVNYVTILDCNYRENDFFFVQTYFIVFSVITAFKINPNTVTNFSNFSKLCQLTFAQCVRLFLYIFETGCIRDLFQGKMRNYIQCVNPPPNSEPGKYISAFHFYCLLCNHSFQTNPNSVTNCFKLILSVTTLQTTFAQCVRLF